MKEENVKDIEEKFPNEYENWTEKKKNITLGKFLKTKTVLNLSCNCKFFII